MKRIKVLWIMTNGIRRNGICVSQLDYFKLIDKTRFQIDTVAVHNNTQDMIDEYKKAGCRVFELADRRKNLFKYLKDLKQLLKREKYDIIHVHGSSALMTLELSMAKKCGVPVRIAHSRNTTCDKKTFDKILRPLFYNNVTLALACGEDAGKWLFNKKNYIVFHNGKDLKKYEYNEETRKRIREEYNLNSKLVFGHVGLFTSQKNHEFLIDVFASIHKHIPNSILLLIGEGALMEHIKEKTVSYGLEKDVLFLGRKSNVEELIQGIDIMLFPSLYEGLPNVVIEWQAAGLPCVISDKITKECSVCNLVKYVPINEGTLPWIEAIDEIDIKAKNRVEDSKIACKSLQDNSFDLGANAKKLEDIYSNAYTRWSGEHE